MIYSSTFGQWLRSKLSLVSLYLLLFVIVGLLAFPYFYMLSMSLMTDLESITLPAPLLPRTPQWKNYSTAFERIGGLRPYRNTLIVAGGTTLSVVFSSTLAGFGLAKYTFKGRNLLLFVILGAMMIPLFTNIIPHFWMILKLGLDNTLAGVMFPSLVAPFGIFMMRQFMLGLPDELMDAARIDGASEFGIYYRVILPLCGTPMVTLGAFVFLAAWNSLLWPLIVLRDRSLWTINLVMTTLQGYGGTDRQLEVAAAAMAVIPVIVMVIVLQRYIVRSTVMTGIRG